MIYSYYRVGDMMDRLLTEEELSKLNSTEGIIELLCNIPNFNSDMYDELDDEQKRQIDQSQRSLMYVALTRAINRVLITGCGEPSSFLTSLAKK